MSFLWPIKVCFWNGTGASKLKSGRSWQRRNSLTGVHFLIGYLPSKTYLRKKDGVSCEAFLIQNFRVVQ